MATAAQLPDLTGLDKRAQLDALRQHMASIPSRRDHAPTGLAAAPLDRPSDVEKDSHRTDSAGDGRQSTKALRTMPVPPPLAELLPYGALARGTALSVTGAGSVLIGLVAAATAAGHHVAVIGLPRFGLLAVDEHGGDLSKVALIDPGSSADPLDAANICIDGLDLVVTTLGGRDVAPTRARALIAKNRSHATVLVVTDGRLPGIDLSIDTAVVAAHGIEQGRGRLRALTFETVVHGRRTPHRSGRFTLTAPSMGEQVMRWTPAAEKSSSTAGTEHRWAVAQ